MLIRDWLKQRENLELEKVYFIFYRNTRIYRTRLKDKTRSKHFKFYGELVDIENKYLVFEHNLKINYKSIISIIPVIKRINKQPK